MLQQYTLSATRDFYNAASGISELLKELPEEIHSKLDLSLGQTPLYPIPDWNESKAVVRYLIVKYELIIDSSTSDARLFKRDDYKSVEQILKVVDLLKLVDSLNGTIRKIYDMGLLVTLTPFKRERWVLGYAVLQRVPEPPNLNREAVRQEIAAFSEEAVARHLEAGRNLPSVKEAWTEAANARDIS